MPDIEPLHIALFAAAVVAGLLLGWILRGKRSAKEKATVNAGWQEQLEAQRSEHARLTEQNKGLMEQISQIQASNRDAKNRAKELSEAVQSAYARRDELQRELKDIRTNLEKAMAQRDELQSSIAERAHAVEDREAQAAKIAKLEQELANWRERVPPLIERFQQRNQDAEQFAADLDAARARIRELEAMIEHGQTRVEPVEDPDSLTDGRDASNDTLQQQSSVIEAPQDLSIGDLEEFDDRANDISSLASEAVNDHDALPEQKDDLQQIKGVGPAIEKTLNELGIRRFEQIADMSEYDIDRVANRLRGFRSRIYREDWIGQARELRDQPSDV